MTTTASELLVGTKAPDGGGVCAKAAGENFPVALTVLPHRYRDHLLAVYGFARLVDDTGDELEVDPAVRLARLDELETELDRAMAGTASHPVFRRLAATIGACGLPREPLADLIEANRLDQRQTRYETFDDLLDYCKLSADPVGRLVLAVFGEQGAEQVRRSDLVCSALQVIEHLQDVVEDAERGRVYIPLEDWARCSLDPSMLADWTGCRAEDRPRAPAAVRRLIALEASRARARLEEGSTLVRLLHGRFAALAVAGYAGGGLAQLDAIEAASYDVLAGPVKASKSHVALRSVRLLASRRHR
jgi:squalene synthase HpnC